MKTYHYVYYNIIIKIDKKPLLKKKNSLYYRLQNYDCSDGFEYYPRSVRYLLNESIKLDARI